MTVAACFAQWLAARAIPHVFTLPGGMIAPLLDSIAINGQTELVTMHHEQAVAFAVDGVGRFTRRPSVGLVTAGPGATNVLTGVASCYLDSVPAIFVMGQVQSYLMKGVRSVRQFGLQECDVLTMAAPVTKRTWRVRSPAAVADVFDSAYATAMEGRPGPVFIEIPVDIQNMQVPADPPLDSGGIQLTPITNTAYDISSILALLADAQRPLIFAGGGIQIADAADLCVAFARLTNTPVVSSITALDVLTADDPLRVGMIGMYGNRWANIALTESDVVIVLGSRLDHGTIGADVARWRRDRTIIQVDCDPAEMQRVKGAITIESDLRSFLDTALAAAVDHRFPIHTSWVARLRELQALWPDTRELEGCDGINPNVLMTEVCKASETAAAYVIDCGQHLWWACQSVRPRAGQRFIPALGLGAVGFALPAAIGVAISSGDPTVVVIGDGALQFNIQEFQTIIRNSLPIKIVLINNNCHGSVRQLQEKAFGQRYPTTVWGYSAPDFGRVAEAYGIPSLTISAPDEVTRGVRWLWNDPRNSALLNVVIPATTNVYPNIALGAPLTAMQRFNDDHVPIRS